MRQPIPSRLRAHVGRLALAAVSLLLAAAPGHARVTRIVIDQTLAQPATGGGQTLAYQTLNGRAFGELCMAGCEGAATNRIITDLDRADSGLSRSPATPGATVVAYVASFSIVKPVDSSKVSGLMWHDVPNRGGRIVINMAERALGDVGLSSGWQGDNAGATVVPAYANKLAPVSVELSNNEWVSTPVLRGSTGFTLARIVNRSGSGAQPLNVMGNPVPYFPADASDNRQATLTTHTSETVDGKVTIGSVIPNTDWKFCGGGSFDAPLPVTSLPVQVCLKSPGFLPALLYQLRYQVKDPMVLGVGTAAFRDLGSFFRHAQADDFGTANPLAGQIRQAVIRGVSQSGNFTRHFIQLGMNQDEAGRIVHEGAWPLIAGRRVANNSRWAQPDGVLELYQQGSEGPQWWGPWPDTLRGMPAKGIFDRCSATQPRTCPKVIESFGGAEVFALKMTTEWVGTSADADIPLPPNVRRYYLPSSTHNGGAGGFGWSPPNFNALGNLNCPGNHWGRGVFLPNPVPATQLVNLLRLALRDWVMRDIEPPPSRWPTLAEGTLVAPTAKAMGFPVGIPGVPEAIFKPENFIFPVFDYDWGPDFDPVDATGVPTRVPPRIKAVMPMRVPRVDADGNELGGVPTVLRDAPLGTYLGWNITQNISATDPTPSFHAGRLCNYAGGFIPFAPTQTDRATGSGTPWAGDPRLSLAERYGSQTGYKAAVAEAVARALNQGYLLTEDADALIKQSEAAAASLPLPP